MPALRYAGFWRRLVAGLIDSVLIAMVTMLLLFLLSAGNPDLLAQADLSRTPTMLLVLEYLLPATITVVLWHIYGGTPGKLLMSCRIIDARSGERPGLGRCVLRYLGYFVSALVFFLGFLWIAWDRRKQGWHDKIAGTLVIIEDGEQILRDNLAGP